MRKDIEGNSHGHRLKRPMEIIQESQLGIKIYRDGSLRLLGLSQEKHIDKILKRFSMDGAKKEFLLMCHGLILNKGQSPSKKEDREYMSKIPYALAIGSIKYAMLCYAMY